ncbi:hypothetical protein M758_1G080300 [Ceratodon purpureus]|uniref:Uncharacterized protein n=1 Tax=Ceratodon purpureus TaxID=3225 RepID=A0A8T0J599_CERPU|nr:hypothetical protein KC19_1G082100 [Ceratodon purpureus]KAG0629148.1 hypothetical protein M758_1G080300 [Ceratodon purpureus]
MLEFLSSLRQAGAEHFGKFRRTKRKCKRIFRTDLLRVILGCNSQSKEKFWNPVPIAHVFRIVQANTAPQAASASDSEDEDEEIVNDKPVSHSRSKVKDKWLTQPPLTPKSEETANKLLILGVSGLSPMTVRRSPSSPSLNENASVWKEAVDLRLPPKVRKIPSSRSPDDNDETRSDPALLDALATAPSKPAVQLNRSDRLSHRRSHSIV